MNTDEDNVGGDRDKDGCENTGDEHDRNLPLGAVVLGDLMRLSRLISGHLEVEDDGQEPRNKSGKLSGELVDDDGPPSGSDGALVLGETVPEVKLRGLGNDNVNPGSAELNKSERRDETANQYTRVTKDTSKETNTHKVQETLSEQACQAANIGTETTVGPQKTMDVANGSSDGVGTRGRIEGLGASSSGHLGERSTIVIEGDGLVCGRVLILNNGENRVDQFEAVVQLRGRVLVMYRNKRTDVNFSDTYNNDNWQQDQEIDKENSITP